LGFAVDSPDNMLVELSHSGDANRPSILSISKHFAGFFHAL
jgi:hypothetical protein